jgi:hypothetical protein
LKSRPQAAVTRPVIVTPVGSSVISVNRFEVLRNKMDVDHQRAREKIVWKKNAPSIELKGTLTGVNRSAATRLLLDSGATGKLISEKLVKKERMKELSILQPIDLINANDTISVIKTQVRVKLTIEGDNGSHTEEISLYVGDIGLHDILLGMPWLLHHGPTIRWRAYNVTMDQCPDTCVQNQTTTITSSVASKKKIRNRRITTTHVLDTDNKDNEDQEDAIQAIMVARALFHDKFEGSMKNAPTVIKDHQDKLSKRQKIRNQHNIKLRAAKMEAQKASNTAQRLAQESKAKDTPKTLEDMIPARYHHFLSVFDEKEANRFPSSKPWDHAIDLKDDFVPKDCKIYPLLPVERTSLDAWITEQLGKGYIRPSKSPQASPFFFVGKKDGKLRPVQDY